MVCRYGDAVLFCKVSIISVIGISVCFHKDSKKTILSKQTEQKIRLILSFVQMKQTKQKRTDEKLAQYVISRMKQLRREHNYSQEYVIENTGLDIFHFESGSKFPTLVSLTILCRFYGIGLREFFGESDYPVE